MVSLSEFLDLVTSPGPKIVAVIGSGCAEATEPVAEISYFWDLPVVKSTISVFCDLTFNLFSVMRVSQRIVL